MIVGIGVDIVDISRLEAALLRTPALASRLFADSERAAPIATLAGTFAAKEAAVKAMGVPYGVSFADALVIRDSRGRPTLEMRGAAVAVAAELGISSWHLSISHDGGMCIAMVVAER
jgi:holo-[acyl-carrier protein] synthase